MSSRCPLPPELVFTIVQYLSDDKDTLRSCTLVSRTWASFSQRALFRDMQLQLCSYSKVDKLRKRLRSVPYVKTLIRGVLIDQRDERIRDCVSLPTYISCLTSVLCHLPNLVYMRIYVHMTKGEIQPYLDLIRIPGSSLIELELLLVSTVGAFHAAMEALEGTNIKRLRLFDQLNHQPDAVDASISAARLHLPSLEFISLKGKEHIHVHDWLTRRADLPNLKQCQISIYDPRELSHWQDVLHRGFPPLKLFKLEIATGYMSCQEPEEDAFCLFPLANLHFQHVHLSIKCEYPPYLRRFIKWWSSTFRALSDSKATIHFTELTFTFTDPGNDGAQKAAWQSLDDTLSHPLFSAVRSIHFEKSDHKALITEEVYPVLVDEVRLVLPRLASRGVLCFV